MMELYTEIEIDAPADRVWEALTRFDDMPDWNPYIRAIEGPLAVGSVLRVCARPSGSLSSTFNPTITKVEHPRELRWIGRVMRPGILDGEHVFTVLPVSATRTRFVHREEFTGLFVWLHRLIRLSAARRGFTEMNRALKYHLENGVERAR